MTRAADGSEDISSAPRATQAPKTPPAPAVHIEFYGSEPPITLPLAGVEPTAAQSYFERVKSEVIEAQRHNASRVLVRPYAQGLEVLTLDPSTIKQVILLDGRESAEAVDAMAAPEQESHGSGNGLSPEQIRRIAILLG